MPTLEEMLGEDYDAEAIRVAKERDDARRADWRSAGVRLAGDNEALSDYIKGEQEKLRASGLGLPDPKKFAESKAVELLKAYPDTPDSEIDRLMSWADGQAKINEARDNAHRLADKTDYDTRTWYQNALLHASQYVMATDQSVMGGVGRKVAEDTLGKDRVAQTEETLAGVRREAPNASMLAETLGAVTGYRFNQFGRAAAEAGAPPAAVFGAMEGGNQLMREVTGQTKGQPGTALERVTRAAAGGVAMGEALRFAGGVADGALSMFPGLPARAQGAVRSVAEAQGLTLAGATMSVAEGKMPEAPPINEQIIADAVFGAVGALNKRSVFEWWTGRLREKGVPEADAVEAARQIAEKVPEPEKPVEAPAAPETAPERPTAPEAARPENVAPEPKAEVPPAPEAPRAGLERTEAAPEPVGIGGKMLAAAAPTIGPASKPGDPTGVFARVGERVKEFARGVREHFSSEPAEQIGKASREAQKHAVSAGNAQDITDSFKELYKREVLSKLPKGDEGKFGAALVESNLRRIREQRQGELDRLLEDPDADPAKIKEAADAVAKVRTTIGQEFKNEAEYQAFVARPDVKAADEAHVALRKEFNEPMYTYLKGVPEGILEVDRGVELQGRVNLIAAEHAMDNPAVTTPRAGLGRVFRRGPVFDRKAKGSAESYRFDPVEMAGNTMAKLAEPYYRKRAIDALVESGDAVEVPQGATPPREIKGEPVTQIQIQQGKARFYVRNSLFGPVSDALGLAPKAPPGRAAKTMDWMIHRSLAATAADAMSTMGRSVTVKWLRDVSDKSLPKQAVMALPDFLKAVVSTVKDARTPIPARRRMELAVEGLGRRVKYDSDITDKPAKLPDVLGVISDIMGDVAVRVDNAARDYAARRAKEAGLPDHEVRRIVGQFGLYAQNTRPWKAGVLSRAIAPFYEAWRTRVGNLGRNLTGSGQIQAEKSMAKALATVAARVGGIAAWGFAESMIAAKAQGKDYPDIPFGAFYLGYENEDGEPQYLDPLGAVGLRYLFNAMGEPAARAATRGLTGEKRLDSYWRSLRNMATAPLTGPAANAAWVLASGESLRGIRPVLPNAPGQSEIPGRLVGAAQTLDPKTFAYGEAFLDVLQKVGVNARGALGMTERTSPGFFGMLKNQLSYFAPRDGLSKDHIARLNEQIDFSVADAYVKALRSEIWNHPREDRERWLNSTVDAAISDPKWRRYVKGKMRRALNQASD